MVRIRHGFVKDSAEKIEKGAFFFRGGGGLIFGKISTNVSQIFCLSTGHKQDCPNV